MADRVLIVDDDPAICKLLEKVMRSNQLEATVVNGGLAALSLLQQESFDVILLDVNLGDLEGFDVLTRLRQHGIHTPVVMVSGRSEDYDTLYGLSLGADDYVTKPFRPLVLGAKVKALIRRSREFSAPADRQLRCGAFRYDSATMGFYKDDRPLDLSLREGALLLMFLRQPNQVFTKDMIFEQVWGDSVAVDDNAIMVYINRLRGKIEPDRQHPTHIRTVRGLGYRFVP